MPTFEYELTTPFSVSKEDMLALLHDPKRFMMAGGSTEEDSIRLDESTDKWHGTAKSTVPLLPRASFSGTYEERPDGAFWVIEPGLGITMEHTWTVEGSTAEVCHVTEKVKVTTPFYLFHATKWQAPQTQKTAHKNMQAYMS